MTPRTRERVAETITYALGVAGTMLAVWRVLQLWRVDIAVPFTYSVDALFTGAFLKGLIETGSFIANPAIGAPGGASLLDFPTADGAHQLLLRLIGLITGDFAITMNVYFLLGFALTTATTIAVLRHLRVSRMPAAVMAILYALLPFHFWRGESHLFLGAYWMVPLAVLVCLWVAQDPPVVLEQPGSWRVGRPNRRTLIAIAICLLIGASGVYYAFFTCFLLLVAGIFAAVQRRDVRRLGASLVLVLVVSLSFGLGMAQSVIHSRQAGPNPEVAQRWAGEAEAYSLRIPQLILPVVSHRIEALAQLRERYREVLEAVSPVSYNENNDSTLGVVMSLGFLALLAAALWPPSGTGTSNVRLLALLNLASLLLGTVAGFGVIIAMLVSPQLRAYNRISVFIAFCCAAFVAVALDAVRKRLGPTLTARMGFAGLCALVLVVGVYDQTTWRHIPDYEGAQVAYRSDAAFVAQVESVLPDGSAVFQLPYAAFPENGPIEGMGDYEHFRAYLHASSTRWSYGATKGREGDAWQRRVATLPPEEFLAEIEDAGFSGVWIDTRGYPDGGIVTISELEHASARDAVYSDDGRVAFIALLP